MPTASGSIAFLGAARFQGFWDAANNSATGSGLLDAASGPYGALFASGSSAGGGYSTYDNLTASQGDYWQVSGSGTHNLEGETDWSMNDWVIYSGSAGSTSGTWLKLAYEDTIASIVVGSLSGVETFNLTGSSDKQVLFITGTTDAEVVQSGSDNFTFDHANSNLHLTGNLSISDNKKLYFGSDHDASIEYDEDGTDDLIVTLPAGGANIALPDDVGIALSIKEGSTSYAIFSTTDANERLVLYKNVRIADDVKLQFGTAGEASIEYDETGTDELRFAGNAATFEQDVTFDNDVTLGVAASDVTTVTGRLTASIGAMILDDAKLYFGSGEESYISYTETDDNYLTIAGSSNGIALSGSTVDVDGKLAVGRAASETSGVPEHTISVTGTLGVSGDATLSGNVYIADDKKLYFGNNLDGYVEYDEDVADKLTISGSGAGVLLSGSIIKLTTGQSATGVVKLDTPSLHLGRQGCGTDPTITFYGGDSGNASMLFYDETDDQFKFGDSLTVMDGLKVNFGSGQESYIAYTETSDDFLTISGSANGIAISGSTVDVDGKLAVGRAASETSGIPEHTISVTGTLGVSGDATLSGNIYVADDKKLYFGNQPDAYVEYDETVTDYLIISSSGNGIVLSGSNIVFDGLVQGASPLQVEEVQVQDDKSIYFGADKDGEIVYNETGDDYLAIIGSSNGIAITGSTIDVDGRMAIGRAASATQGLPEHTLSITGTLGTSGDATLSGNVYVADDKKLYFGSDLDAYAGYDEAYNDFMVISGSQEGLALSGTLVRVVDKLAVGIETLAAKTSGIFVVSAHADDTTNGLIATFKSGDSDYCRVNIDNSTANGDTQFTFMSNGSSKWSVGNMGSNETFHIKSGFGNFADSDPFVLTTTALTLNTSFTASAGGLVKDDAKLYFGDHEDGYIEYDEGGNDFLVISGSANGLTISGSTVAVNGNVLPDGDDTFNLGSAGKRWANIYTGDLHLKNDRGDWTIVEEEDYLSITNNNKGKKYKFVLEEIE